METENGVDKAAATAAAACALERAAPTLTAPAPAPEEATPTLTAPEPAPEEATPTLTTPVPPEEEEKEPEAPGKCYKKTVGEEGTFLETAKDYLSQFKDTPAKKHWICIKNRARAACDYVSEKTGSVFGRKKVEPVVKDDAPEVEKPAPVESH